MFAVIENGSRQHRVQEGDFLSMDYQADLQAGASVTFDKVFLANAGASSVIGRPTIEGATVVGEVVIAEEKGPKLEIQKLRRRKNSRRHTGHRQKYTRVQIKSISVPGLQVAEQPAAE
ncbi:MAG: 50S ribosomal protein L21 [Planctomycetaceae bacterium]|nr:50S ribosomal protein L21 [Planctomycetaceae bacterium]